MKATTPKPTINDLSEKFDILFDVVTDMKTNQSKPVVITEVKEKSKFSQHLDAFVNNALTSPHSTLSGLAVGAAFVGSKMFPQYAEILNETQIFFTGLTGVTAGSALIKPKQEIAQPLPSPTKTDNDTIYG